MDRVTRIVRAIGPRRVGRRVVVAATASVLLGLGGRAASAEDGFAKPDPAAIDELIKKGDEASIREAGGRIDQWFKFRPQIAARIARHRWVVPMMGPGKTSKLSPLSGRASPTRVG